LDDSSKLVSVEGVIIKQHQRTDSFESEDTIVFPSFLERLKDIVLYITNNSPVCIIGPIGSGKSTTIRQAISIFGRKGFPDVINVQMNNQIDARVLLGSYHSTDLPGQFVWKPGCLTKAVLNGHWIVLEDIDAAPVDVITLLDGFVDTKTLSVPGYGEIDYIHPDFKLFSTCRSHESNQAWIHNKIGKLWKKIHVQQYTNEELKIIVENRFPHLNSIVDVLVNIYSSLNSLLKGSKTSLSRQLSIRY
jgi:midasin